MYVIGQILVASVLLFISPAIRLSTARTESSPDPVMAQTVVPVTRFSSLELRDGGKAVLRHGPQRVTLIKGSVDYTSVTIAGGELVVDKCQRQCPRGYELEIEIVTPDIARISIANGGMIQSRGNFPRQPEIAVSVSNGGTIDIRSMAVDSVIASVDSGGRIFTKPQIAMLASVVDGGIITYWGDARVKKSIRGGGVVTRGTADEADKPLSELGPEVPPLPVIPPLPAIQPLRNLRR